MVYKAFIVKKGGTKGWLNGHKKYTKNKQNLTDRELYISSGPITVPPDGRHLLGSGIGIVSSGLGPARGVLGAAAGVLVERKKN